MDKTQSICLGSPQQLTKLNVHAITLANVDIEVSDEVTCLGVVLDSTLTFVANVRKRAGSCFHQLLQVRSVCRTLSVDATKTLLVSTTATAYCTASPLPICVHFSQLSTQLHVSSPASDSSTTSLTLHDSCATTCTAYQSANASNSSRAR